MQAVLIALSMYTRLPVPRREWKEGPLRWVMAAFPLAGVLQALALLVVGLVCRALGLAGLAGAAAVTLLPVLFNGGIHLDGFCDVVDALSSHAPPERMREILKDPRAGAFAVIGVGCYLLGYAGLASLLAPFGPAQLAALGCLYVLERALSGLAVVFWPRAKCEGLAHTFGDGAARRGTAVALGLWALAGGLGLLVWGGPAGALAVGAAVLCFLLCRRVALVRFGGVNGDVAGWFLQCCELSGLAALVLLPRLAAAPWGGA